MDVIKLEENWPRATLLRLLQLTGKSPKAAEIVVNFIKAKWRLSAEKVYICCPAGDTAYTARVEMLAARAYIREAESNFGVRGIAPRGFLPEVLNDRIPTEKKLADDIDKQLFLLCSRIFVCGNRITPHMKTAIFRAADMEKPIFVFTKSVIPEVFTVISESRMLRPTVYLERGGVLSMDSVQLGRQEFKRVAGEVIG